MGMPAAQKHALIVDDSKTAQVRLQKILARYELAVDTANSAEEALNYLSYSLPSVIFMDHLMEGMDGFEALKIIKSNPDTAMVPIIMYTSKSGDLYIGQARALGAIDVVSKDHIEPSNLDKVLGGINILPKNTGKKTIKSPQPPVVTKNTELENLRIQITKLLDIHISRVRQEFMESSKLLIRYFSRELKELKEQKRKTPTEKSHPEPTVITTQAPDTTHWKWLLWPMILVTVLSLVTLYTVYESYRQQQIAHKNYVQLTGFIETQYNSLSDENKKLLKKINVNDTQADPDGLIQTLAWAINAKSQFHFNQMALGDESLSMINELITRLNSANFTGTILLNVHFGDFCITRGADGALKLPKPSTPIKNCILLSTQPQNFSIDDQLSLPFINFLLSSPLLREKKIRVEMESKGLDQPATPYPNPLTINNAGEWNNIAKLNNRLEVELLPDE